MKAIRLRQFETTPALEDIPAPDVFAGQLLVRVEAAALNPLDKLVASGVARQFFTIDPPLTVGTDLAGEVVAVGSGVTGFRAGDPVVAWLDAGSGGAVAEFALVPASACVPRPIALSAVDGSAIPTAGITAWHALFSAGQVQAGETVLIHAAAGGVGGFAVQFAKLAGATVIATASGDGVALAHSLGADTVVDYRSEDFAAIASDVNVVLDLVGGETQVRSYKTLRSGGRLISTIMPPDADMAAAHGVKASMFYAKPFADRLGELVETIAERGLKVVIDTVEPVEGFDRAWERQTSGRARGKIVVRI